MIGAVLSGANTLGGIYQLGKGVFDWATDKEGQLANKQMAMTKELAVQQNEYNKEAVERQFELEKQMYEYTGYNSKVRQLKEAGLNPSLLYSGGAGSGGVTGNIAAPSASLPSAPNLADFERNKISKGQLLLQGTGIALQMQKLQSEIEVNKSIANSNNANAGLLGSKATTEGLIQKNYESSNQIAKLNADILNAGKQASINKIIWESERAGTLATEELGKMRKELAEGKIAEATIDARIDKIKQDTELTIANIIKTKSETNLNDEKVNQISHAITQKYMELRQNQQELEIDTHRNIIELQKVIEANGGAMNRTVVEGIFKTMNNLLFSLAAAAGK